MKLSQPTRALSHSDSQEMLKIASDASRAVVVRDLDTSVFDGSRRVVPSKSKAQIGTLLVRTLGQGVVPEYGYPLRGILPTVPEDLVKFRDAVMKEGLEEANEAFYTDEICAVPESLQRYVSGDSARARVFKDKKTQDFWIALFHHIKNAHKPTSVELAGWDLYHGHLFVHEGGELGMLFHAKEYPSDMPFPSSGSDPREGSQCSTRDADYHLRNYLWLMSANKVILLDPKHESFPSVLIEPTQRLYFTVDEGAFMTANLGSVNYFGGTQVLMSPNRGFPVDLQIKYADSNLKVQEIIGRLGKKDLLKLLEIVEGRFSQGRLERIAPARRPLVKMLVEVALQHLVLKREQNLRAGIELLMQRGYSHEDALNALLKTETEDSVFSVFRAERILAET